MKNILAIILMALLSYFTQSFFPWWSIGVVCFVVSYLLKLPSGKAFMSGFLAIFLLWIGKAILIDQANDHILLNKIGVLFSHAPNALLIFITGFIGGLVGGMAAWSASFLNKK
jgi:hypothetical protein